MGHRIVSLTLSEDALSILVVKRLQVRQDQLVIPKVRARYPKLKSELKQVVGEGKYKRLKG